METRTFKTTIKAPAQKVWDIMTAKPTYEEWVGAAFPGSTFAGEWKRGTPMRFTGPDGSGMLAEFTEVIPAKLVKMVHVAVLLKGGKEDYDSDMAQGLIGTTEDYILTETDGITELTVEMKMNPEWTGMFEDSWPKSLEKLREICEE